MASLHPLARELNERLQAVAPEVFSMLSSLGRRLYFPKGILSQSAEAGARAKQMNATIGSYLARTDIVGENALIPEEQRQKNGRPWIPGAYKGHFIEQFVSEVLQK